MFCLLQIEQRPSAVETHWCLHCTYRLFQLDYRGVISSFSWGGQKFFSNATGLLKNWKKQHFICSNLTLFIVPFFLFSLFSLSFLFFLFFSFFFFFFSFSLGGGGATTPAPQMTPLLDYSNMKYIRIFEHLSGAAKKQPPQPEWQRKAARSGRILYTV